MTTTARLISAGTTLSARSACDHDCLFKAAIHSRKGQFCEVSCQGATRRVKIHEDENGEFIYALGRYSMAPIFRA